MEKSNGNKGMVEGLEKLYYRYRLGEKRAIRQAMAEEPELLGRGPEPREEGERLEAEIADLEKSISEGVERALRNEELSELMEEGSCLLTWLRIMQVSGKREWRVAATATGLFLDRMEGFDLDLLCDVAADPRATVEVLDALSLHESPLVREGVAVNPSTPKWILGRMAEDGSHAVKAALARNRNTPPAALDRLAGAGEMTRVRMAAAANPSTPEETLERLSEEGISDLLIPLAANPSTPDRVLEALERLPDERIHAAMDSNPRLLPEEGRARGHGPRPETAPGNPLPEEPFARRTLEEMEKLRRRIADGIVIQESRGVRIAHLPPWVVPPASEMLSGRADLLIYREEHESDWIVRPIPDGDRAPRFTPRPSGSTLRNGKERAGSELSLSNFDGYLEVRDEEGGSSFMVASREATILPADEVGAAPEPGRQPSMER